MATCTPQALPRDSTCFHCIPPDAKRVLKLYLLNALSNSQTALQLSQAAAQYRPIDNKLALAAKVYLLSVISGVSPTAATLEASAKCYQCIPPSARLDVETYLTAVSAAISLVPATLTRLIGPYKSLYPIRDQVEIYLLNFMAGGKTLAQIMAGAKCLTCLSTPRLEEIYIQLLCNGLMPNLIPVGSVYSGGATPEFDLTVLTNTSYLIIWGTNDVSMVLCGVTYPNTGAGTTTVIANTGACSVMQFFGFFGGTTVTARVQKIPTPIPAPTGFTWVTSGGNAIASWNAPPAGVFSTELWTSTDNITFSLAATVVTPGTSATVAGPAAGQTIYAKIRFTSKVFPGYSAFTSVLSVSGLDAATTDWVNRVIANGGASPSNTTISAADNLVVALKAAGIWTKMRHVNIIAPDSMIALRTPFLKTLGGNDPYVIDGVMTSTLNNTGFVINQAVNSSFDPGINLFSQWTDGTYNFGISCYFIASGTPNSCICGCLDGGPPGAQLMMQILGGGVSRLYGLDGTTPIQVYQNPAQLAFYCGNKVASNNMRLYFATSVLAWQLTNNGTNATNDTFSFPNTKFRICAMGNKAAGGAGQNHSDDKFSFFALHTALSSAEGQALFNAVQTYRQAIGGGFI